MSQGRALVTGAGGFIGYNLSNYLVQQGWDVQGVDLHYPDKPGPGREARFRAVQADFRDEVAIGPLLRGTDVLLHLAGAHLEQAADESEYWDVNARSVPVLLDAARRAGVQRVVHVSSVGIYGRLETCPADEQTPCRPQSIYGRTKWEGEKAALEFARLHAYPVVVLRPAWVYGPGCPRTLKIFRTLRKKRFPMIGRGTNLRHPVFIEDFVRACEIACGKSAGERQAFVIAGERAMTSGQLIEAFCNVFAVPRPWLRVPYPAARMLATGAETMCGWLGREPPISRRMLEFFDTDNAFDIAKARRELGFYPQVEIERGLEETRPWLESTIGNGNRG